MVLCYLFTRNYSKNLLSYDKLFKDDILFKKIYKKSKQNNMVQYNELKEQKNIFCEHVSNKLGNNIKHFYKNIYPKR